MNFKNIHIGSIILQRVNECNIENTRICNFLKCNEIDLQKMYSSESLDSKILLRWSKLLEYDFFRIYSQHLILFSPPNQTDKRNSLPQFRKNLYTKELIDFIVDKIKTDKMTTKQVIENYRIPKTTLHKWLEKNK